MTSLTRPFPANLTVRERRKQGLPARVIFKPHGPVPVPERPERLVWFALTTMPQSEEAVAHKLYDLGYAAFNPVEMVAMRACRRLKFKRKERERSMLTSMVLAGFWGDGVPWRTVLDQERVTGVVGIGGVPAPIPVSNVLDLMGRNRRKSTTRNWSPQVGCQAEIITGAWQGHAGKVVELVDGMAKVVLFGTGEMIKVIGSLSVSEQDLKRVDVA